MSGEVEQARFGRVAVGMLDAVYQHRLLSTRQLHALFRPDAKVRGTQRLLAGLNRAGLLASVRTPDRLRLWFLTDAGIELVETVANRDERRRKLITRAQAAGPLQQHTLAVNEVGVSFVRAARERGDLCGPFSWRNEIAHPLGPPPGRRQPEQLIADAVLTYERSEPEVFEYRFIELDRSTMPVDDLAIKLARYARLYRYTRPAHDPADDPPAPLWQSTYAVFPSLLLVLAHRDRATLERRRETVLALCESDGELADVGVNLAVCLLADLSREGPFAGIFRTLADPERPVDWLGQPGGVGS